MRPRWDQIFNEDIFTVRRKFGRGINFGLTNYFYTPRFRINNRQVTGGIVFEESIVMSCLKEIARFVRGASRGPLTLHDFRTRRDWRRFGCRPALRNAADKQVFLIGQPTYGGTEQRIEVQVFNHGHVTIHQPHPETEMFIVQHREREALAVHGSRHVVDFSIFGQCK